MPDEAALEARFWKALRADRTVMLGLAGTGEGHAQPMTAQFDGERNGSPVWFFTSRETDLARAVNMGREGQAAVALFAGKGHDLFAAVDGKLSIEADRARVDQLWNPYVAAWFEGGKSDPKLELLRFEFDRAQIWLNEHSLIAGVRMMLGSDPKRLFKDKVATLSVG
jgi:general stress protein 26